MAKSKLLTALDSQKGRNYELEKQKSLQKKAAKRKKSKDPVSQIGGKENIEAHTDDESLKVDGGDEVGRTSLRHP